MASQSCCRSATCLHASTLEQVSAVRDRAAGAESRSNLHHFCQLSFRHTCLDCCFTVNLDAVGTLSRECDGNRDELL